MYLCASKIQFLLDLVCKYTWVFSFQMKAIIWWLNVSYIGYYWIPQWFTFSACQVSFHTLLLKSSLPISSFCDSVSDTVIQGYIVFKICCALLSYWLIKKLFNILLNAKLTLNRVSCHFVLILNVTPSFIWLLEMLYYFVEFCIEILIKV